VAACRSYSIQKLSPRKEKIQKKRGDKGDSGGLYNMQHTAYPIWETFTNRYSYTLAFSQSSIKSYASYSLLKNSSIEISSIGLLEQCSPLHYLIIFFFGRYGMIFLAFFAGTDLRTDFLAVWTKNLSRLVHN
jgi:hypothetical protein